MLTILFAVALVGASVYAAFPRRPDLTAFDPDFMGQLEYRTWRYYYERKYFHLLYAVYRGIRHLRFSPADSVRIAWNAGRATRLFQTSTSSQEADDALPALIRYFSGILPGAPVQYSSMEVARAERAWWQARREAVPPEQYGLTIAHVANLVYGVDTEDVKQAGILRARAMTYRDQRKLTITASDWDTIAQMLKTSYALLKSTVSPVIQAHCHAPF